MDSSQKSLKEFKIEQVVSPYNETELWWIIKHESGKYFGTDMFGKVKLLDQPYYFMLERLAKSFLQYNTEQ